MKFLIAILIISALQGCTIVGYTLDRNLGVDPKKSKDNKTLTDRGIKADYEILMSLINDQTINNKKTTSCSDLTGREKTECFQKVEALNESIKKHSKQQ